jgi:asparagine synthase (glutamine-hydrolysing)
MCGIAGIFHPSRRRPLDPALLALMTRAVAHRGPDSEGQHFDAGVALGFRRLAIVDVAAGAQPMYNEDRSVVSICNGEFYNYSDLAGNLVHKGHRLQTRCDSEVLPHLYEEYGIDLLQRLSGQFALAIYDKARHRLFLARDHFGINPLHYADVDGSLAFASEIKALLALPGLERAVDLTGLDQVLCLPGAVSPTTLFRKVRSVPPGHFITCDNSGTSDREYWDIDFPLQSDQHAGPAQASCVVHFRELMQRSVAERLQSDVPVGMHLSGGLDSCFVAGLANQVSAETRHSFSVSFGAAEMCESKFQKRMTRSLSTVTHEIPFDTAEVANRLQQAIYHAECPLKESHDTACLAIAEEAKRSGVSVALTGQGSDELFAGYIGYRFDKFHRDGAHPQPADSVGKSLRERLFGDPEVVYDGNYASLLNVRRTLYSEELQEQMNGKGCFDSQPVNVSRIRGRHYLNQRSYLDLKLRLADHLLTDHGDRMAMAHAVEVRHPFLDKAVVEFARTLPPELKLNGLTDKHIVREAAAPYVPREICRREKFGWFAPGTPALLPMRIPWVDTLLSPDTIRSQGYFNPDTVERLKHDYTQPGFCLNQPFGQDLLMFVLTFGVFLETFQIPALS